MKEVKKETTRSDFSTLPCLGASPSSGLLQDPRRKTVLVPPHCAPPLHQLTPPPGLPVSLCSGPILLFLFPSIFVLPFQAGLGQETATMSELGDSVAGVDSGTLALA